MPEAKEPPGSSGPFAFRWLCQGSKWRRSTPGPFLASWSMQTMPAASSASQTAVVIEGISVLLTFGVRGRPPEAASQRLRLGSFRKTTIADRSVTNII
jgi:hypothetical protein